MYHISLGKLFQAGSLKVLLPQILSHGEFLKKQFKYRIRSVSFLQQFKDWEAKEGRISVLSQVLQERLNEVKKNKAS